MRKRILGLVLGGIVLIGAAGFRAPADGGGVVAGELLWTQASTCEWPPGTFLNYYVQGCRLEDQVFLAGSQLPADGAAAGERVWATGRLLRNGSCLILDVAECQTCTPTPGPAIDRD